MRGSREHAARDRRDMLLAVGLGLVVVAAVAGIVLWFVFGQKKDIPGELLCPSTRGPSGHVILLVDKTDPLAFTQGRALTQLLEGFAKGRHVKEGELLSVFVLDEDFRNTADPTFEKCNPGDGSSRDKLTENPTLWKRKYENEFVKPLMEKDLALRTEKAGKFSPILEMLQVVSLRYEKYAIKGPKTLYIVSDMLHNTLEFSMYPHGAPAFQDWKMQPGFARLRAKLPAVQSTVFMLMNTPKLQNRSLAKFWEDYFIEMGGSVQKIDPLPG